MTLKLTQPPALQYLSKAEYTETLKRLCEAREASVLATLRLEGKSVASAKRLLNIHPFDKPTTEKTQGGLNPSFATITRAARRLASEALRAFRNAYAAARATWSSGLRQTVFPEGTYWLMRHAGVHTADAPCMTG